jgi:hypothetical protein
MNKCANCENEAFFAYLITSTAKINYCKKHIPGFLKSKSYAARLIKLEKQTVVEAPKTSKKKAVVEETPVVEEPIVVEETTPVVELEPEEPTIEVTEAE